MTIAESREKCKSFVNRLFAPKASIPRDVLIITILALSSTLSFGLGYLAGIDAGQAPSISVGESPLVATTTDGQVVASKSGSKYYFPWCSGVDRISTANKVWFSSAAFARAAGYSPAENCKGP